MSFRASLGERVFAALLRLLPSDLRTRHAADLRDTFRDRQRRVLAVRGTRGLPALWLREAAGLLRAAVRARRPDRWARHTRPSHGTPSPNPLSPDAGPGGPHAMLDRLLSDLRWAVRGFRRRPGVNVLAAVSLALGIGASTAMFSVVDSVLLKPLPFDEPERLVSVYPTNPELRGHPTLGGLADRGTFSWPEVWDVRKDQRVFEAFAAWVYSAATLTGGDRPERLPVGLASEGLFEALGASPVAGRFLTDAGDAPVSGARHLVLSEPFWRERFGADPDAVGRTVELDEETWTVVGVVPEGVRWATTDVDLWQLRSPDPRADNRGNHDIAGALGRLRGGVTLEQARDEVAALLTAAPEAHDHGASVFARLADITRHARPALLVLMGAALVLLLVGCGNMAALLLGAGIDRHHELAVRGAVGAGRGRIAAQLLTESVVLAGVGALGGMALATLVMEGLIHLAPPGVPRLSTASVDGRVLAFAAGLALLSGLIAGLFPSLGLSRTEPATVVSSSRGASARRSRVLGAVVAGELALATLLLVGAGLMGRTLAALNSVDPGFETEGLVAIRLSPPLQRFRGEEGTAALDAYFGRVVDEVEALPGVESVAVTSHVPLGPYRANNGVRPEGWPDDEPLVAERRFVSEGYFATLGIPLVAGRDFDPSENRQEAAPTVVISESLARRAWPEGDWIGRRLDFWNAEATVVGVAADIRDESLGSATRYAFYAPIRLVGAQVGSLMVRVTGDPPALIPAIRDRVAAVDPDLPVVAAQPYEEILSGAVSEQRYRARLFLVFAALAALFAVLGVYGVTARSVARRTREMGIRVALGARPRQVRRLVIRQGLRLALWGAALGLAVSLAATRTLEGFLYGVERTDPLTLGGIAVLVGLASVAAALQPALRATRTDPVEALRAD